MESNFQKIIGDGDSSVYKKIKENKPYGPSFFIEKNRVP
jgi:hypothetical protein